ACSAPGGKACQMAEILAPTGSVDATDIHAHKINLIKYNIKKLGLNNVHAFQHDATQPYTEMYDKILVDAPCSGLGVLRHKPEIKYTQSKEGTQALVDLQLNILNNVKHHLKPGGTIIYSTCTIEQLENENVIYSFLKENKDFEFEPMIHPQTGEQIKTLQILPQDFNSDGFFITKIKRKES
nr:methyltransferase domain-containing protein [Staphylococcus lugdunensis]